MTDIIIAGAVSQEIDRLADQLQGAKTVGYGNRAWVCGELSGNHVRLLTTGPGIFNTVHALTIAVMHKRPRLILQTGCGGIFKKTGGQVGDIAIASSEIDLQTGIESVDTDHWQPPTALPFNIAAKGGQMVKNRYPVAERLSEQWASALRAGCCGLPDETRVHYGPFVTVSTITASDSRADAIEDVYKPCMESMEGSAAAYVAFVSGLPFVELRSASNRTGKRDRKRWNIELACERCCDAICYLLRENCLSALTQDNQGAFE